MVYDPTALSGKLVADFEAALKGAYEQGVRDGIARIVAAAQAPISNHMQEPPLISFAEDVKSVTPDIFPPKAPRGTVPLVVHAMLQDNPGKTIQEYERLYRNYDTRISDKSIGNELRRFEGEKYERDAPNGYRWFLIGQKDEAKDAATNEQSSASDHSNQGGSHGAALDL